MCTQVFSGYTEDCVESYYSYWNSTDEATDMDNSTDEEDTPDDEEEECDAFSMNCVTELCDVCGDESCSR